ncbi:MAG: mechanosensitive ion channel family protein, partial [Anaerolineales bacterium]
MKIQIANIIHKSRTFLCLFLFAGFFSAALSSCQMNSGSFSAFSPQTTTPTSTSTPSPAQVNAPIQTPTEEQVISTPTLAPTATPGQLDNVINNLSQQSGLDRIFILGLTGQDLLNILISVIIVVSGSIAGWFLIKLVVWLSKITPTKFDEQLVAILRLNILWFIITILLQHATARLDFLSPELKQWLDLGYFAILVIIIATIVLKIVEFGLEGPLTKAATPEQRNIIITFFPLFYRLSQVVIIFASLAIILQNFGFNLSALLAILGLGGLAVSLAAKETLADMISGFIILIEHPYQVGDRIKIETMDDWGDVESIGMRTTRIRTLDNRLVIVPNAVIGRNQVENYTYPDPSIRVDISVGIGYGSDYNLVETTIEQAVLSVPGLLEGKAPFVELHEFGDSAMIYRVRYWLKSYNDIRLQTEVKKAIYQALSDADVDMPFITY